MGPLSLQSKGIRGHSLCCLLMLLNSYLPVEFEVGFLMLCSLRELDTLEEHITPIFSGEGLLVSCLAYCSTWRWTRHCVPEKYQFSWNDTALQLRRLYLPYLPYWDVRVLLDLSILFIVRYSEQNGFRNLVCFHHHQNPLQLTCVFCSHLTQFSCRLTEKGTDSSTLGTAGTLSLAVFSTLLYEHLQKKTSYLWTAYLSCFNWKGSAADDIEMGT